MKIAIATGTRADWGLLFPLANELLSRGIDPLVIATNAHFFPELGMTVNEIKADGFSPVEVPTRRDPALTVADVVEKFSALLREESPDCIVILGDRYEMMGAATAALLERIPIVHIAGGNVTLGAYDDAIRNSLTQLASLHLPETELCRRRIISLGADPDHVINAGSAGVYNGLNCRLMTLEELENNLGFKISEGGTPDFLVATLHPATLDSVPDDKRMADFLRALQQHLAEFPNRRIILTYPNSDRDTTPLIDQIERFALSNPGRVLTVPSLGRIRYLSAVALSRGVIGNSSSAIEETPSLGIPTLDIGIRQQGRERGAAVFHCDPDTASITAGLRRISSSEAAEIAARRENPYFKPNTPVIQADAILNFLK